MNTIRERSEQLERDILSAGAALAAESKGRARDEEKCSIRTDFQRDRDRIIHSKAFRRLKHKTQVFIDPEEDHHRTRLTHTLEVAQIARTISRALRLNEDLTEAIALGHDLGHTPFGHAGERALDEVCKEYVADMSFKHSDQSLRVVDLLEKGGIGLNLTWEVRDGIRYHSKGSADLTVDSIGPATMEGKIVRICDRIAYINHDIDDAIRAGIISLSDLPQDAVAVVGAEHAARIGAMVYDVIDFSSRAGNIGMSEGCRIATDKLKDFMYAQVYGQDVPGIAELKRASDMLKDLFRFYMDHPEELPELADADRALCGSDDVAARARRVCDFISGMTDRYAQKDYAYHFLKWL